MSIPDGVDGILIEAGLERVHHSDGIYCPGGIECHCQHNNPFDLRRAAKFGVFRVWSRHRPADLHAIAERQILAIIEP